jgi:hypothetical protein
MGGLWLGLVVFGLPAVLVAWFVYSEGGRRSWDRHADKEQRAFDAQRAVEGLPPPPPRSALGRWAVAHPRAAVVGAGVLSAAARLAFSAVFGEPLLGWARVVTAVTTGALWGYIAFQYVWPRREGGGGEGTAAS